MLASTVDVERRRNLPDGSYLARLAPHTDVLYPMQQPVWLRIIEYQVTDERLGEPGQVYHLATTWLNPRTAPAKELLVLYHERREIEIAVDEIKTHLHVQLRVLRSHTPQGVRQELYALFVVHFAIRAQRLRRRLLPKRRLRIKRRFGRCTRNTSRRSAMSLRPSPLGHRSALRLS
jgi:hypothetical protein